MKKDDIWEFEILPNDRNKHSFAKPNTWLRLDTSMIHTAKWGNLSLSQQALWITILCQGAALGRLRVSFKSSILVWFCKCKSKSLPKVVQGLVDTEWLRVVSSPTPLSTDERTYGRTRALSAPKPSGHKNGPPIIGDIDPVQTAKASAVLDVWNANCGGCRKAKELNPSRRKRCVAILQKYTLEQLTQFAADIGRNDFCTGNNDRGWVADFDYFIRESTLVKASEGGFMNKKKQERNIHREIADAF